ncbi:MAG: hypothetical protein JWM34_3333 [Ilumatobacteraceae bacterium]|nr:hypothetical protein [Ilumatobacteraceae bacterium]
MQRAESTPDDLLQVLRALQRMGLPRTDIEVHLERIRAVNDATVRDAAVERNCLLALEMTVGDAGEFSLSWDSIEMASIYVPRVVTQAVATENLEAALEPSDMLPPRPGGAAASGVVAAVPSKLIEALRIGEWFPLPVDEFRVPKGSFTTRPAALLSLPDRLVFEVLASRIETELDRQLPGHVIWPRRRGPRAQPNEFRDMPKSWSAPYVVKADISGFYESIDHSVLAMILAGTLDARSDEVQATEHFLGAVMGRPVGLPQGPLASDVFASAYLLLIDQRMVKEGWQIARFADDYFIAADSMADGRNKIEELERYLADHHLRLNDTKTTIMRHDTYLAGLDRPAPGQDLSPTEFHRLYEEDLHASKDDREIGGILSALGADEQLLFDVLYHQSMTIEEAIEELAADLNPGAVSLRLANLSRIDEDLRVAEAADDMSAIALSVRDSLAFMAAAKQVDALGPTERLLHWFPDLGRVASAYFEAVSIDAPYDVDLALVRLLQVGELPDWTSAWLCRSVQRRADTPDETLMALLRTIIFSPQYGALTHMASTWALASKGALTTELWTKALADASSAVRAELLLAKQSNPQLYPDADTPALSPPST